MRPAHDPPPHTPYLKNGAIQLTRSMLVYTGWMPSQPSSLKCGHRSAGSTPRRLSAWAWCGRHSNNCTAHATVTHTHTRHAGTDRIVEAVVVCDVAAWCTGAGSLLHHSTGRCGACQSATRPHTRARQLAAVVVPVVVPVVAARAVQPLRRGYGHGHGQRWAPRVTLTRLVILAHTHTRVVAWFSVKRTTVHCY